MQTVSIHETLHRFVNSRERAYRAAKSLKAKQMNAITQIRRMLQYYQGKPERVQPQLIRSSEAEIKEILPAENSHFAKLREKMLNLIDYCKQS